MTAFVLKIIALICMIIDHTAYVFPMYFPEYFRVIGRLAFPLYVFLIAEGCRHTRSMKKYLFRLALFALISEIPFDLAFNQNFFLPIDINFINDTNIFYTLFLGVLCVYALQIFKEKIPKFALALSVPVTAAAMFLAYLLETDYGAFGVAFIFLMYITPRKIPQLIVMAVCCCYEVLPFLDFAKYYGYIHPMTFPMLGALLFTVPLAAFYYGRRGPGMKWLFYIFYPAHLLIFAVILLVFVNPAFYG